MSLATLGGKLLVVAGKLAESVACCCVQWCRQIGTDICGNPIYGCRPQQAGSIGECTPQCSPPETPCECGPNVPCPQCYECIERQCVRIEDCCADGTPCPPCHKCVDGTCVPCGPCEQCIGGECQPCGPCQKCEDGVCVECGADEVCIDGVCVPKKYYCCWDSCADKRLNTNNTTCVAATVSGSQQVSPCGEGSEEGYGTCDLTKSGPHTGLQQCEPNCQKYDCVPDACGNNECVPDDSGEYPTLAACLAACDDPCGGPCTFTGASAPGVYSIDGCAREICVSYSSLQGRPIRVQIWGPIMENGCEVAGTRVIKTDSNWRGDECCDCTADRPAGALQGGPKGQVTWNKPRGATWFEVYVFFPCPNGSTYELDIKCDAPCDDLTEPEMCQCDDAGDCDDGCSCCNGRCRQAECECETDDDCPCWAVDTYPATDNLGNPINPDCAQIAANSGDQWLFCGPNAEAQANAEAARRYTDPAYAGCDHTTNPAGNAWCCNGTCKSACRDCAWPGNRFEVSIPCTAAVCCGFPFFLSNSRNQSLSQALPGGITWKAGYPALLDECNYRWCTDTAIGVCYDANANACRFITKTRYKLLAIDCDTQTVVDKTNEAANGVFETTSPGACTDGPNFPAFFSTPELVCPP